MTRNVTKGNFSINVTNRNVVINGLSVSPSETDKVTSLVSVAGRMSGLAALPETIQDDHFLIRFGEDGIHSFSRLNEQIGFSFSFEEIDELIQAVQAARAVSIDMQKINPVVGTSALARETPDIFEGRE